MYEKLLKEQQSFFKSGVSKDLKIRREQLITLRALLKENKQAIIDAVYADFSKPAFETYGAEIGLILDEISYALRHLNKWAAPERVRDAIINFPSRNRIIKEPYGTTLIIAPWNYPVQLSLLPLVGALAAGNTAIIKPSELTPNTAALLEDLVNVAFEPGYVRVVTGGVECSRQLLELPFDYIFFTGSTRVGRIVMEAAAKHLTPVTLELGGKSPCIVDETADIDITARRIIWGKCMNAGQTCVAPDYVLVHPSVKEDLLLALKESIRELYGDDPAESDDYPRIVNDDHFERLTSYLKDGQVYCGGKYDAGSRYIAPTVLTDVSWDQTVMKEEIFGPILPVLCYSDTNDIVEQIHHSPKPLALYIFTKRKAFEEDLLRQISFGGGAINDTVAHLGNPRLGFGGVGPSGIGNYHGRASFDTFSHRKSIMKKNFMFDPPIRYAPYDGKMKWLKLLFG